MSDTPRTDAAWAAFIGCPATETHLMGTAIGQLCNISRCLERELAEAKATQRWQDFREMKEKRDTAHAEAQKWRECAEAWRGALMDACPEVTVGLYNKAANLYNSLCHPTPTPSSPPSQPLPVAICYQCGTDMMQEIVEAHGKMFCTLQCADQHTQELLQLQSLDTVQGPRADAPAEATASQLAALESKLELLVRRTDFLLANHCTLMAWGYEQSLTAWPADLALTASTSTLLPTSKPESSGEGK